MLKKEFQIQRALGTLDDNTSIVRDYIIAQKPGTSLDLSFAFDLYKETIFDNIEKMLDRIEMFNNIENVS